MGRVLILFRDIVDNNQAEEAVGNNNVVVVMELVVVVRSYYSNLPIGWLIEELRL